MEDAIMEIPEILLEKILAARTIGVLTGAGVSAESGISTFRDPDGLWTKFNPMELSSIDGFMANPERVWEWYQYRKKIADEAKPNPGHYALAEMEKMSDNFYVFTQNVDRLHQRAGLKNVYELHGNIIENKCFDCGRPYTGPTDLSDRQLPVCPYCGGKIRPNVVWFGEQLPQDVLQLADSVARTCDVFFSVGTSAEVYPAAALPHTAKQYGAFLVEVNPNVTSLSSYADVHLQAPSGEALPRLIDVFKKYKEKEQV
jgi:NAD-dependent deacetylase